LGADLSRPETWYTNHAGWHGLMLQLYQDAHIHAIKTLPCIRQLFTELYDTSNIIANTEKVSFNPPETATWKFVHDKLHWDIDFANPDPQYIQGLVYLDDVPENRGPLTVVPGFHHRFDDWMGQYPDPDEAQQAMRNTFTGTPVPGKKGDIVLWLQAIPHAASANHSGLPRFAQYINFSKC
jgi:ectoine hydroxylase-related dioxygenase (phytanoyl-CoA dioxygenase family)